MKRTEESSAAESHWRSVLRARWIRNGGLFQHPDFRRAWLMLVLASLGDRNA